MKLNRDVKAVGVGMAGGWAFQKLSGMLPVPTTGILGLLASAAAGAGAAHLFGLRDKRSRLEAAAGGAAMQAIIYPALQARGTPGFSGFGLGGATVLVTDNPYGFNGATVSIE